MNDKVTDKIYIEGYTEKRVIVEPEFSDTSSESSMQNEEKSEFSNES